MATSSTFYLNGPSLASATAAFTDDNLTICAADGFYSDGVIVREQVGCVLLPQQTCPSCATPCGEAITASGVQGLYLINLETGTDIGAIIIRFDPAGVPDGIRASYNSLVYNKLTSPVDGLHQSTGPSNFTVVGATGSDCGLAGNTTNFPTITEFLYNGTTFLATGNTQSITIYPGDVSLGTPPGNCMLVIPKSAASPSIVNIEIIGPCGGTAWGIEVNCPELLTGFESSVVFASSALACGALENEIYYSASLNNIPGSIDVYDFVYSDNIGSIPLANGFYYAPGVISGGADWFQVTNGVVVAVGNCP